MSDTLDYLRMFAQYPWAARRFMRQPLTVPRAREIVKTQMEHRTENFLRMAQRSVYGHPASPYLALLKTAGCTFGDLERLVRDKGLEGALTELRAAGVYVTFEEFKGRKPIVRNGQTIPVRPQDFDNPWARHDFTTQTGGSTGLGVYIRQNLDHIAACVPQQLLMLSAHDALDVPAAVWAHILPGSGLGFLLKRVYARQPTPRWFSGIGWRDSKYWLKYDLATLYMLAWLKACGAQAPVPRIARPEQPLVVVRWMRETLDKHGRCLVVTSVSRAARACIAAQEAGIDLGGAIMRIGAEPITPAKVAVIEKSGARTMSVYGAAETGEMGVGCARPNGVGDVHLVLDKFAFITYPFFVEAAGVTVPAFNLTTLSDDAPKLMLNFQSDDYGLVETRHCDCELDQYGYTTHLRDIRSYSKLLGEGVTLIGNELQQILEEALPALFGGTPLDYQLLEEEESTGLTRLYLLISPRLTIANEQDVIDTLYQGLGAASPMADAARAVWQHTQTIQVRRQEPIPTARGKLLPLYIQRN